MLTLGHLTLYPARVNITRVPKLPFSLSSNFCSLFRSLNYLANDFRALLAAKTSHNEAKTFLSFLPRRERPFLAGNGNGNKFSSVRGSVIVRLGDDLNSFSKDNNTNFFGEKEVQ